MESRAWFEIARLVSDAGSAGLGDRSVWRSDSLAAECGVERTASEKASVSRDVERGAGHDFFDKSSKRI